MSAPPPEGSEGLPEGGFEVAEAGIAVTGLDGRFEYANPAFLRALGLGADELSAVELRSMADPAEGEGFGRLLDALLRGDREGFAFETPPGRSEGSLRLRLRVSLLRSAGGAPERLVVLADEAAGRTPAEHGLHASQAESPHRGEELRATMESMGEAFYLLDSGWRMIDLNAAGAELARRSRRELEGQVLWEAFPDVVGTDIERMYRAAVATGEAKSFVFHYEPYALWVEVRCYPSAHGLAVYMRDCTAERRAEQALEEVRARLRNVIRATTDVIWEWDIPADRVWWSEELHGRGEVGVTDRLSGLEGWIDRIHPLDRERVVGGVRRALDGGGDHWEDEYRFLGTDGAHAWVRDRGFILRDAEGTATRMVGGISDDSEYIEAQRRIREQAELLDRTRDAILVRDPEGRILYWNRGAEGLYGWPAVEVVGRRIGEVLRPRERPWAEAADTVLRTGEWAGEGEFRRRDGSVVPVETRWSLVRGAEGEADRILEIHTDITERKRLLAQLLRTQRMESLGTLARGVAHDLNNALAPILASIAFLREEPLGSEAQAILRALEGSARRGAQLVRQILAFAHGVEGRRVSVSVQELFEDLARVVRDTFPRSIRFRTEVEPGLPPLLGDPGQLRQVLLGLLENARDATGEGGLVTASASNVEVDAPYAASSGDAVPGPYVLLTVSDTGTGIPPENLDRIFEPFFTTKEVGQGTGLGLSTIAAIVRSHEGFIHVASSPGRGTTVRVHLPAGRVSPEGESAPEGEGGVPRGEGELILVVEDEQAVREAMRRSLEAFGYRVLTAVDGADGVAAFGRSSSEIALVVTDLMMPVLDGITAIRALRRIDPEVPIVAVSGMGEGAGRPQAEEAGAAVFLAKPFRAEALLRAVHDTLRRSPRGASPSGAEGAGGGAE